MRTSTPLAVFLVVEGRIEIDLSEQVDRAKLSPALDVLRQRCCYRCFFGQMPLIGEPASGDYRQVPNWSACAEAYTELGVECSERCPTPVLRASNYATNRSRILSPGAPAREVFPLLVSKRVDADSHRCQL